MTASENNYKGVSIIKDISGPKMNRPAMSKSSSVISVVYPS